MGYSCAWRLSAQKAALLLVLTLLLLFAGSNKVEAGEALYRSISAAARQGDLPYLEKLVELGRSADWEVAQAVQFEGNLRLLKSEGLEPVEAVSGIYLVRELDGTLYILSPPGRDAGQESDTAAFYRNLETVLGDKLVFEGLIATATWEGETYRFIRFTAKPQQLFLDRVFKTSIMFMFFFVMLGMGLTLTAQDFVRVARSPRGILLGLFLQWLLMPLLALGMAYLLGFYHSFPFIYAGLVLICACPGGVTSNLMTYYAKGDLALSVSLTSISTVLALFFTPLILTVFSANIPDIEVPAGLIVQTIIGLVLVPLIVGMSIRRKWSQFATRATPFFSALGILALLTVIGVGIITNAEKFADTERYSFLFYTMVVSLSILGMLMAAFIPRLLKIGNYQGRAISMEVGLRNSTLAVTIALLIQDLMGDFYSSMFVTTAIYGITMYMTGFFMIMLYRRLLPLEGIDLEQTKAR